MIILDAVRTNLNWFGQTCFFGGIAMLGFVAISLAVQWLRRVKK